MSRFGQGRSSATVYARAVAFYLNFGLLFKYAGQNCNIESVRVCVTQGRQAGMQDNFDDLLIHIGSKAKKKARRQPCYEDEPWYSEASAGLKSR